MKGGAGGERRGVGRGKGGGGKRRRERGGGEEKENVNMYQAIYVLNMRRTSPVQNAAKHFFSFSHIPHELLSQGHFSLMLCCLQTHPRLHAGEYAYKFNECV